MSKVIIIGGGASGLVSAIYASIQNNDVTILEKNSECGKKILITGNGRCNYWNSDFSLKHFHSANNELLSQIITKENQDEILAFFQSIGIIPKIKDGYYYPNSNQAISIQNALITEAALRNIKIIYNEPVKNVSLIDGKYEITTNKKKHICNKVIIATGSLAAPKTGSTGDGYEFAKNFGHTIIKPLPALVKLKSNAKFLKEWQGIRVEAEASLFENNKFLARETGEIQLTDCGISGICIFQLSYLVSIGLNNHKKEELQINFLSSIKIATPEECLIWLEARNKKVSGRTISKLLDGVLNYKLSNLFCKLSNIDKDDYWNNLGQKDKEKLSTILTKFPLSITNTNSYDEAQVCTGGIPLTEIDLKTMQSKFQKNLYFTGEILDVNGDCGGYNLGLAWITGMIAGVSTKDETTKKKE